MDPMIVSLITAAVGAVVGYVGPKLAARTKNKVDDAIVRYAREHLPDIVALVESALKKKADPPPPRPRVMDHRK